MSRQALRTLAQDFETLAVPRTLRDDIIDNPIGGALLAVGVWLRRGDADRWRASGIPRRDQPRRRVHATALGAGR